MKKKEKYRSLSITLTIAFLIMSAVVLAFFSSLNIYFNFQNQVKAIARQQQFISQEAANTVKNFSEKKMDILKITASIYGLIAKRQEMQELILLKLLGNEPAFRNLVIFNTNSIKLCQVSRLSRSSMSWQISDQIIINTFNQAKENKEYVSPIYIDKVTNEPMMMMAVQIMDSFNSFNGILIADVNLKFMWDLVGSIKVGNKGSAYVVDKNGNLIAFGDISRVLKGENLSDLKEVSEFQKGRGNNNDNGYNISRGIQDSYVVTTHTTLGIPDWAVIVELPILEAFSNVINTFILSLLAMVISFVLAIIIGIYVSKRIIKPIKLTSDSLKNIADGNGDLTERILINSNNEVGMLAKYFNDFTISLINIIKQIKVVSFNAKNSSDALSYSSEQSSVALEETTRTMESMSNKIIAFNGEITNSNNKIIKIDNSISEISELITNESSNVNESSSAITQMLASIKNISNITETKYDISNSLFNSASRGNEVVKELNMIMKEISDSTTVINDFIVMINNIASQTNMLSMNASIESAHAGDYGKGFSVVAEEIRTLADSSTKYSKEISKSLKKVIEHIQVSNKMSLDAGLIFTNMLNGIKEISNSILEIKNAMEELVSSSNQIITALNSLVNLSGNIKDLSNDIKDNSNQIKQSMMNVSNSSLEINNSIKETSISMNEIYKAAKKVSIAGSENLITISELELLINKFKTE